MERQERPLKREKIYILLISGNKLFWGYQGKDTGRFNKKSSKCRLFGRVFRPSTGRTLRREGREAPTNRLALLDKNLKKFDIYKVAPHSNQHPLSR